MITSTSTSVFINIKADCQYFETRTEACSLWGSPICEKCSNYIPKLK
ncbi:MAG: hypothetical protein ACFFD1_01610 [Candidatus Thorarchaeota archaeon]